MIIQSPVPSWLPSHGFIMDLDLHINYRDLIRYTPEKCADPRVGGGHHRVYIPGGSLHSIGNIPLQERDPAPRDTHSQISHRLPDGLSARLFFKSIYAMDNKLSFHSGDKRLPGHSILQDGYHISVHFIYPDLLIPPCNYSKPGRENWLRSIF